MISCFLRPVCFICFETDLLFYFPYEFYIFVILNQHHLLIVNIMCVSMILQKAVRVQEPSYSFKRIILALLFIINYCVHVPDKERGCMDKI